MYTVLIYSHKTMEDLHQYYPLLSGEAAAGRIGFCLWNEDGKTVETAVPDLYEKVHDKEQWRAVLLNTQFPEEEGKLKTDPRNPFDYAVNKGRKEPDFDKASGEVIETDIPEIRLAHLLCGLPAPRIEFQSETIYIPRSTDLEEKQRTRKNSDENEEEVSKDENDYILTRRVFKPVEEKKENGNKLSHREACRKWEREHVFEGSAPAEMILIHARNEGYAEETYNTIRESWEPHNEYEASDFWERNLWPEACRFLSFGMNERGALKRQQKLFELFTAVLLIALNEVFPDTVQAHRLYDLSLDLDPEEMKKNLQGKVVTLNRAYALLAKSAYAEEGRIRASVNPLPGYQLSVPVKFVVPQASDVSLREEDYHLTGGPDTGDYENWHAYHSTKKDEMSRLVKSVDRTLDSASWNIHSETEYKESDVKPLNKYQCMDLDESLDKALHLVLQEEKNLPESEKEITARLDEANAEVEHAIGLRVTKKQALYAVSAASAASLLVFLPVFHAYGYHYQIIVWMVLSVIAVFLGAWIILSMQRRNLLDLMHDYEGLVLDLVHKMQQNAAVYTEFLSGMASHIHGSSYRKIMEENRRRHSDSYYFKQKNMRHIEVFRNELSIWNTAMHLDVDMNMQGIARDDQTIEDIDFDMLYSLFGDRKYMVPMNYSGEQLISPFSYIRRMNIVRVALYESPEDEEREEQVEKPADGQEDADAEAH